MTIQRYYYIRKYIFIFSILFLLSGCDIIDELIGSGKDDAELSVQQEQALTTVLTLQDDASDIMDNLFSSGMDTLSAIDSLAIFFLSDTSIQNVWADSEGVAVEYNNGISGGIFVGRYNSPIVEGSPPDTFIIELPDDGLQKRYVSNVSYSPLNKKSIYFDGAYTQFKTYNDDVINAANNSFAQVNIAPFVKYVDYEATLDVLSTLGEYGIIHLSGHGWRKYSGTGLWADKVTYLLTGEVAQVGKTYSDLWKDVLEKNIIIANYKGDNRYWVSPKFISDRNNFHDKEVFFYNGICNGLWQPWRREIVINAGASVIVGYKYPVQPRWSYKWEMAMYRIMCDTSLEQPETIRNCIRTIIKGPRGYYDDGVLQHKYVHLRRSSNGDYTFWEIEPPLSFSSIRFEYVLDTYWNPSCFASDVAANNFFEFDQYALLVSPISLTIDKIGNTYSGSWDAIYDWGDRWHTGSILFTLNDEKTKATLLNLNFSTVNSVTNSRVDEYNISLKDIDCNYSDTAITLSIKNKQTCSHITRFDLWQDCWIYTNGDGISNLTSVGCSETETANTYYFIQIDLKQ